MLGKPARLAGLLVASACCAGAAFAGCGFETGGLVAFSGASGTTETMTTASTVAASGTSGSTTSTSSAGTGGHGGAGTSSSTSAGTGATAGTGGVADAGSEDAGPDAAPVDAGPIAYASCLDWLGVIPGAASGVYKLLDGSQNVYEAYCEMAGSSGDGGDAGDTGGWTLVLKINGNNTTFPYGNTLWTTSSGLNPGMPDLDMNEAELASFWSVPFTEMKVGMIEAGVTRWLVLPLGGTSLLDLINKGANTNLGRGPWEGLVATGSLQTNCNWEGINAKGHVRIGIVGDESTGCDLFPSPDSFIGFGADGSFESPSFDCGNIADGNYSPDHGGQSTPTFGYVMVR